MAITVSDTSRRHRIHTGSSAAPPISRRVWARRALALSGATLASCALAVAVAGSSLAASSDMTVDQAERERQRLQEKQAEVAAQIDVAKASSEELIAALATLDQQVQAQLAKAAEAERAFRDADRRYKEFEGQLNDNQLEVDRINNELRQQAVRRYLKPEDNDSSVRLLKANDFDEAQQKKVLSDAVAGNSKDLVERLRGARGRLESLQQQASDSRTEAETRKAEQNELSIRVISERDVQKRLQDEWDRRVRTLQASRDEINAEAAGIDQAIARQRAAQGGSAPAPQSANGRFIWPVSGRLGDGYGGARNHPGIDILAQEDTPIWAAQGGKVVQTSTGGGYNGGYGNLVVIDHPNGLQTRYAHQKVVKVSVGQSVTQGQVIGTVGLTGNTSGYHLHFEVYLNGVRQNPMNYLP
jgi:murein DD-endopeptidase MepM/ murein hydrolase activator NlpD